MNEFVPVISVWEVAKISAIRRFANTVFPSRSIIHIPSCSFSIFYVTEESAFKFRNQVSITFNSRGLGTYLSRDITTVSASSESNLRQRFCF